MMPPIISGKNVGCRFYLAGQEADIPITSQPAKKKPGKDYAGTQQTESLIISYRILENAKREKG
jgi:hypothetical protein